MKPIIAKSILIPSKHPSAWFGAHYMMNLYRGCEHGCIYCDSRSACYGIEDFAEVGVKVNGLELLKEELPRKRKRGTIATGAMSDPYTPLEKELKMTRQALAIIAQHRFPVHITTKSNLILRDVDILEELNRVYVSVAVTITTVDDDLARKIEPHAPSSTDRFKALGILAALGIETSITLMPILPFLEDDGDNLLAIVEKAAHYGVKNIVPAFGVTLRDRQREYYYSKLDELFPGLRERYESRFKDAYHCSMNQSKKLGEMFREACRKRGISTEMPSFEKKNTEYQLSLFLQHEE